MKKMPRTLYLCLFLLVLGVIAGGILAGINELTAPVIAENAKKELARNLKKVGVTDPEDITSSDNTNATVIAVYTGKFEDEDCYVMNTTNTNKYTTVNVLVVISKDSGTILNLNISGTPNITTHGFDDSFTNEALGVINSSDTNSFSSVSGATVSSTSVKTCLDEALKMREKLVDSSVEPEIDTNPFKDVNVTDIKALTKTYVETSVIKSAYEGKYENQDVYAFETAKHVIITEPYPVDFELKMLVVVSKDKGSILNFKITSAFDSRGPQATEFGMIGATSTENFEQVTSSTYSSNVVKDLMDAVLTEYATLKLANVTVTDAKNITTDDNTNATVKTVFDAKYEGNDCYVVFTTNTNPFTTVNVTLVIGKTDGKILAINVTGKPAITTHAMDAQINSSATHLIGQTDSTLFSAVTKATFSSTSVKTCVDEALKLFGTGGAE